MLQNVLHISQSSPFYDGPCTKDWCFHCVENLARKSFFIAHLDGIMSADLPSLFSNTSMLYNQIDGLVQDCSVYSADVIEIWQSCTKPLKCYFSGLICDKLFITNDLTFPMATVVVWLSPQTFLMLTNNIPHVDKQHSLCWQTWPMLTTPLFPFLHDWSLYIGALVNPFVSPLLHSSPCTAPLLYTPGKRGSHAWWCRQHHMCCRGIPDALREVAPGCCGTDARWHHTHRKECLDVDGCSRVSKLYLCCCLWSRQHRSRGTGQG